MIKTILVPSTGDDRDSSTFNTALAVARAFSAHLDFLHVRIDPADIAVALSTDIGGGMIPAGFIDQLEEEAAQREDKARKSFQVLCEREHVMIGGSPGNANAVSAEWHREIGVMADWIGEYGRTSDLVVTGRSADMGGAGREALESALLETGRPLLIPGPKETAFETVAIAWKSTREAARAVSCAVPFLARAKRIVILTVAESGGAEGESGVRLSAAVCRHNAATEARQLQPGSLETADALLAAASEVTADLLVMGGYSHSRLRELVLGGVTEHVLRQANLPVLMVH